MVIGVVATQTFAKGDIVCDYHGKIITAAEGRAMMEELHGEPGYLFFFKNGNKEMCVDSQTFPCECHPEADTVGRRINHSSKSANVKPFHCAISVNGQERDVIIFRAMTDIKVDSQLKFDYGVKRTSFRGEGLDLTWLDDQAWLTRTCNFLDLTSRASAKRTDGATTYYFLSVEPYQVVLKKHVQFILFFTH